MLSIPESRLALRREEVWRCLGLSRSLFGRLEREGKGPPRRRVSRESRVSLYPVDGLRKWLEEQAA